VPIESVKRLRVQSHCWRKEKEGVKDAFQPNPLPAEAESLAWGSHMD
jgi:hypothetical protein